MSTISFDIDFDDQPGILRAIRVLETLAGRNPEAAEQVTTPVLSIPTVATPTVATPTPTPAKTTAKTPAKTPAKAAPKPTATRKQVRDAMEAKSKELDPDETGSGNDRLFALLEEWGAEMLKDLPEEKYADFIQAVNGLKA